MIDVLDETGALIEAGEQAIRKAAETALKIAGSAGDVCAAVVSDARIREMNAQYRAVDAATDVLSFANGEGEALVEAPEAEAPFLGDIAISLQTAARQAEELGQSLERELAFLTVHGVLHLLGYDHMTPEDEEIMLGKQREIMSALSLSNGDSQGAEPLVNK